MDFFDSYYENTEINTSIKYLYNLCSNEKGKARIADMQQWLLDIALDLMMRTVIRNGISNVDEEEPRRWKKMMEDTMRLMFMPVLSDSIPLLKWFDIGGVEKEMIKVSKEMDEIVDVCAVEEGDAEFGRHSPYTIVKATVMTMVGAGSDTTAVETFRIHPPGALLIPREFSEDCIVGGYHVPKGTMLFINLYKLQRDPKTYPDPSEFKPERFLEPMYKDIDPRGRHYELFPFGAGRRSCPGLNLGIQNVHLILAHLLHAFDVSTVDDQLVDMTASVGLITRKAAPVEILITPRLSQDLYY
ncbi:oxygenase [Lithospermum erythrorhizon]|uniref:Oxygenase n=1 Tax=Lithospermum erythrorhizon TaxID=34254 RepID=A0AAV3RQI6_LITER